MCRSRNRSRDLRLPKSSVSRSITNLEARLGVRLIERTTRSVALTEAGELYLDRCRRMLEEAEQADLVIGVLQAKPRGRLRVGAPVAFARFVLGPVLGDFVALYPEVRLHMQLLSGGASFRESGDVVIRPGPLEDSGLLVKPLMKIRIGLYASPRYLDVMCQEVVVIERRSADGWELVEAGVGPVPVVLVGPDWQRSCPVGGVLEG
jgi:DNA-binding transcriptional LysR family regulator